MKKILTVILFLFAVCVPQVSAGGVSVPSCSPILGGGQSCIQNGSLTIDKTVKNPGNNVYVNNLNLDDSLYTPDQEVSFRITINNTSANAVSNITVQDIFPILIDFKSGSGTYDSKTKTLTFNITKINPKETKVYFISGKVVPASKLPGTICVVNQSTLKYGNFLSQDNSQVCISKPTTTPSIKATPTNSPKQTNSNNSNTVKPTNPPTTKGGLSVYQPTQSKKTPPTGPEALAVIGLLPASGLGFWLRKKAMRKK